MIPACDQVSHLSSPSVRGRGAVAASIQGRVLLEPLVHPTGRIGNTAGEEMSQVLVFFRWQLHLG